MVAKDKKIEDVVVAKTVVAHKIVLASPDGKTRIGMGVDDNGVAKITLLDANEKPRASLMVTDKGPSFGLLREGGEDGIVIGIDKEGNATVSIGAGRDGYVVGAVTAAGKPGVTVGVKDKGRVEIDVDEDGPALHVRGPSGEPRASVELTTNGLALARLFDAQTHPRVAAAVTADGDPMMILGQKAATDAGIALIVTEGHAGIEIHDKGGDARMVEAKSSKEKATEWIQAALERLFGWITGAK